VNDGGSPAAPGLDRWIADLTARHLADLTPTEVARALRALSSTYVERRARLSGRGAFDSAGKRAAYALYYGPRRYLLVSHVVRALDADRPSRTLLDLGCGTGAAGAAWAAWLGPAAIVHGVDVHPWALDETRAAYRALGIAGSARRADLDGDLVQVEGRRRSSTPLGVVASYVVNELPDDVRRGLLPRLLNVAEAGGRILVIEPLSRRTSPWWTSWAKTITGAGGRADEWRLTLAAPAVTRSLGRAAGLDPDALTGRTLWL
jgi:hypothetical protein